MSNTPNADAAVSHEGLNANFIRHFGRPLSGAMPATARVARLPINPNDPPDPPEPPLPIPHPITIRCQPKVLVVCDVGLGYAPSGPFGSFSLWRFVHAITEAAGVTLRPNVTLAHRGAHGNVTIGTTAYAVQQNFRFDTAVPAVNLSSYDQIWIFGHVGPAPSNAEVAVLAAFMNRGGGVVATGDHATLGFALCGNLPRIRAMREWSAIPMGAEGDAALAARRIDTITSPGADTSFDFDDQSDGTPQRIFPKYTITDTDGAIGTGWSAALHPLLAMPGSALVRTSNFAGGASQQFRNDIDVLPDHAHESVCKEFVGAAVPAANYTLFGQNFAEFQPNAANPAFREGSQIVAFGVSGGRAVMNGVWKPPVQPQMFGLISAYDGQLAQPYAGNTTRPGRIVCDSTWHHFLNINLDGSGANPTSRQGLGSWSGGTPGSGVFTPSADLNKIYTYYRNTVSWLQPANRVWCTIFVTTLNLATKPALAEDLMQAPHLKTWTQWVGLGRQAQAEGGSSTQVLGQMVQTALGEHEASQAMGRALASGQLHRGGIEVNELVSGVLGGLLVEMVQNFPDLDALAAGPAAVAADAHHDLEQKLKARLPQLLAAGLRDQARRAQLTSDTVKAQLKSLAL